MSVFKLFQACLVLSWGQSPRSRVLFIHLSKVMSLKVHECSASQREDCKHVFSIFLFCIVNFHLGSKNSVFKAKVILLNFCKKWWIFQRLQRTLWNLGPLSKIPQMIYLQKRTKKNHLKSQFQNKRKPKSQRFKVSKINLTKWVLASIFFKRKL